jgi:hypothetical protein
VRFSLRRLLLVVTLVAFVLGVAVSLIAPAVSAAREAANRMSASTTAKHIVLAMQNYHDSVGVFPAAIIRNADGKAMRGWRFALVPYLEATNIYRRFDHDRLWDDPKNLAITQFEHRLYDRPGQQNTVAYATNFVAITGPGTLFPDDGWRNLSDIKDGAENTIVVVEIGPSDIPWYEPRDLRIDNMSFRINVPDGGKPCIGSRLSRGAIVAFADAHVELLPEDTDPEKLRAMLTIAGDD